MARKAEDTQAIEYKSVPIEFKASSTDEGVYEGYFSVFGNVDDGGDIVMPGAFTKTILERGNRIKVLYAHEWDRLIGPAPDVLKEDTKGLYAKGRLSISKGNARGSFWADEAWALMKDDALNEGSFGYMTIPGRVDYNDSYTIRTLHELKLYEISPVPLGMNPLTEVSAVKRMIAGMTKEGAIGALEDVAFHLIKGINAEKGTKEGRILSSSNLEKVKTVYGQLGELMDLLKELIDAATSDDGKSSHHLAPLDLVQRQVEARLRLAGVL